MIRTVWLLILNSAIPSWISAVTIVVLAIITWWYAKSAKRQANAAESQASAATKQAEAAERTLTFLQSQIEDQAGTAITALQANVVDLKEWANHWYQRMMQGVSLTEESEADRLPNEWAVPLERARRRISPALYQELQSLQRSNAEVSRLINQFCATERNHRQDAELKRIRELLAGIMSRCDAVSTKFGNLGVSRTDQP